MIEDEEDLREIILFNLEKEGYRPLGVENANDALIALEEFSPDLILLDLMLPGLSGFQFLHILRNSAPPVKDTPVIVVSARTREGDIVRALEEGADDYVTKPFSVKVLLARVGALLRRTGKKGSGIINAGGISLDPDGMTVSVDGEEVSLTRKEFELLALLVSHPGRVFTRNQLLTNVWGYEADVVTRTVDAHVSSLRKKLGNAGTKIKTVPRIGYRLDP